MTTYTYRALLLAAVATGIVSGFVDLLLPNLLPESFRQTQEAHAAVDSTSTMLFMGVLSFVFIGILIVATYGLFRFRSWAPRLALVATALGLLLTAFLGVHAQSGLALAAAYLSSYLWGAILLLPFLPSFSANFHRRDG